MWSNRTLTCAQRQYVTCTPYSVTRSDCSAEPCSGLVDFSRDAEASSRGPPVQRCKSTALLLPIGSFFFGLGVQPGACLLRQARVAALHLGDRSIRFSVPRDVATARKFRGLGHGESCADSQVS